MGGRVRCSTRIKGQMCMQVLVIQLPTVIIFFSTLGGCWVRSWGAAFAMYSNVILVFCSTAKRPNRCSRKTYPDIEDSVSLVYVEREQSRDPSRRIVTNMHASIIGHIIWMHGTTITSSEWRRFLTAPRRAVPCALGLAEGNTEVVNYSTIL